MGFEGPGAPPTQMSASTPGSASSEASVDVSVVLAARNEEESIGEELRRIIDAFGRSPFSYEIIVVDDASTDKTASIVERFPEVRLIRSPVVRGSGGARKIGTHEARGALVAWTDADLTYPNERLPELARILHERAFDQVVGARTSEGGTWRWPRAAMKWFIRRIAMILSGANIPDLNSGMRVFRRDVALRYLYLLPAGFSCVSTMTLAFLCNGHTVGYEPIAYRPRVGRSKFHPVRDTYAYFLQVVRMVMVFNPLKVFMPIGFAVLAAGVVHSAIDLSRGGSLEEIDIIILLSAVLVFVVGLLADLIVIQRRG